MAAFERHNADVRASVPGDRLLEWRPGDGWAPICAALDLPVPDEPFPHVNSTANSAPSPGPTRPRLTRGTPGAVLDSAAMERTLVLIKPDALAARGLVGEITTGSSGRACSSQAAR